VRRGKEEDNRLFFVIFLAVLVLCAGCGIKGPPKVPRALVSPPPIAFCEGFDTRREDPEPMEVDDGPVVCHVTFGLGHWLTGDQGWMLDSRYAGMHKE